MHLESCSLFYHFNASISATKKLPPECDGSDTHPSSFNIRLLMHITHLIFSLCKLNNLLYIHCTQELEIVRDGEEKERENRSMTGYLSFIKKKPSYNLPSLQTFSNLKELELNHHILMKRTVNNLSGHCLAAVIKSRAVLLLTYVDVIVLIRQTSTLAN